MTPAAGLFNPFPGLRPFEPDEDFLFFGREAETDELLRRLRTNRFLLVVGTSGCGKSSLIRSGLIPSLHSGLMSEAGSSWRIAILRPGEDPMGHLAAALDEPDVMGTTDETLATTNRVLLEATLRRGTLGLVDAVRQAQLDAHDRVLVVVDQFEELFRFQRTRAVASARDEAVAFVKLLLAAASQNAVPIYVVLTMRSDFIGECMEYPGLPEAINDSHYLVPRLTRDELRTAITGPIAVAGGRIAPRLVLRLLNDVGNDADQLPVLQHALMRTWEHWQDSHPDRPIDISDYEAIGTLRDALSRHAEEAFLETGSEQRRAVTERIFKALIDTFTDPRGVRRPCSIADLAAVAEAPEAEVIEIIEIFRRPGRSFLMPPATVPLNSRVIVDLSHESLMRCWGRLIQWAEEDRVSAAMYARLTEAAAWYAEGTAGLWRDPELELGLRWRRQARPTAAWAARYDPSFDRAMAFLDRSERERDRLAAERRAERRRKFRQLQWIAGILGAAFVLATLALFYASRANARAEANFQLARNAVDESLSLVDRDPQRRALVGPDDPQVEALRRELLTKAQGFYLDFIQQRPDSQEVREGLAFAHLRLGHINRSLDTSDDAIREYTQAIERFSRLVDEQPARPDYRQALANAHNWLGETLRVMSGRSAEAKVAYDRALALLQPLHSASPDNPAYRQDLARTHSNRGILQSNAPEPAALVSAEADFREAIRLLEPLATRSQDARSLQEISRAYNNLGSLVAFDEGRLEEAQGLYEQAVSIHEELTRRNPGHRDYKLELVKFDNNLADVLRERGQVAGATTRNRRALNLIEDLARPSPMLGIDLADTHNLRARILESESLPAAIEEYRQAVEIFRGLQNDPRAWSLQEFHLRVGDLLVNLAILSRDNQNIEDLRRLVTDAVGSYLALSRTIATSGSPADAQNVLENFSRVMPELSDRVRPSVDAAYLDLKPRLEDRAAAGQRVQPGNGS